MARCEGKCDRPRLARFPAWEDVGISPEVLVRLFPWNVTSTPVRIAVFALGVT